MDTSPGGERPSDPRAIDNARRTTVNETPRHRPVNRGLGLLTLILIGLVVLFVGRNFWPSGHPATDAAYRVKDHTAAQRLAAIHELERLGPKDPKIAIPALVGCLGDNEAEVRAAAAMALVMVIRGAGKSQWAGRDVQRAVTALLGSVNDRQANVRSASVQAPWMIAVTWEGSTSTFDRKGINNVLLKAAGDPDKTVRLSAVRGLGVRGLKVATEVPPVLLGALEDASEKNRAVAAEGLVPGTQQADEAAAALAEAFEVDPNLGGTHQMIEAIARFGPTAKNAIPCLRELAQRPRQWIREAAQNALAATQ